MRRKVNLSFLAGLVLTALITTTLFFVGISWVSAAPSLSDIVLTNIAAVNWNSGTIAMSTNVSNLSAPVGTNYGMVWIGMTNVDMASGEFITNDTYLSNEGNATADFVLTFTSNVFVNSSSKLWSNTFTNYTDGGPEGASITVSIAPAGGKNIWFLVGVPNDETNNAAQTFQCLASNVQAAAALGSAATNYVGFNGTSYGGVMGNDNAGGGNVWLTNTQTDYTNWLVTVKVADIELTKNVGFTNSDPFADPVAFPNPMPGALITYQLTYTNRGGLVGSGVKIIDTLPTNFVVYKDNSMRRGAYDDIIDDYSTLVAIPTDLENDDDGATNSLAAEQIVFAPTNGSAGFAPAAGGLVGPGANGSYFFQVYLK